jgi:N-acetyl-beta-hexosaminidase
MSANNRSLITPYNPRAAWGKKAVYSHAELHDIVQHAWERGIRVIPEWEMPGHAYGYVHTRVTTSI